MVQRKGLVLAVHATPKLLAPDKVWSHSLKSLIVIGIYGQSTKAES